MVYAEQKPHYKVYIYSASLSHPKTVERNSLAEKVVNMINLENTIDYDCCGDSYCCDLKVVKENHNMSVVAEGDDLSKIVYAAMRFATLIEQLKKKKDE